MINMKRAILPFEKESILKDEVLEHIKWYQDRVKEGYELLENGQKSEAREKLREINKQLEKENRHYQMDRVSKPNLDNTLFMTYSIAIHNALAHQSQKNSFSRIDSNLYDISDYLDESDFNDL